MQAVRFGITGSGYMARTHAESIRRLGSLAKLVAIWGGSRAPDLAARFGVDNEATVEGLARRPDIDAIVVTTPHQVHVRDTLLALEAGKHVLVEKPMATTLEDCDRMAETAARRGLEGIFKGSLRCEEAWPAPARRSRCGRLRKRSEAKHGSLLPSTRRCGRCAGVEG